MLAHQETTFFTLVVSGQIQSAQICGYDDLYVKFQLESGPDWVLLDGLTEGISQLSKGAARGVCVWNFPVSVAFKSTNCFGTLLTH